MSRRSAQAKDRTNPQRCSRLVLDIESAPNYVGRVNHYLRLRGRDNLIPMKVLDILPKPTPGAGIKRLIFIH
jgi:hypothetical protein